MFRGNLARTGVYDAPGIPTFNAIKWKFETKAWINSSPAVAAGVVYFESYDSNFYALDAASGELK